MSTVVYTEYDMKPYYTPCPRLDQLNMTSVLKSIVACRVCRGQRLVAEHGNNSHLVGYTTTGQPIFAPSYTFKTCPFCQGLGTMSNNEEDYER